MIEMVVPFCTLVGISAVGEFQENCEEVRLPYYTQQKEPKNALKECLLGGGLIQLQQLNQKLYNFEKKWVDEVTDAWNKQREQVIAPENKIHRYKPGKCEAVNIKRSSSA